MTYERQAKRVLRKIRSIPVDAIESQVTENEQDGMWLIVADELEFVTVHGDRLIMMGNDVTTALFDRYVWSQPDRVHATYEDALAFVRQQFGMKS